MNIAIDLTAVPANKSGVGRYVGNLIERLQLLDNKNNYLLIIQDDDVDGFKIMSTNFKISLVDSKKFRNIFKRLLWEQIVLPRILKSNKIDILHSPHYTMPYFIKVKRVVTFHDMTFFIMPKVHTLFKRVLFKIYMKLSAMFSTHIACVSNATAQDLIKILKVDTCDITVTPLGVDQIYFNSCTNNDVLSKYGINESYFLYVGTLEPRKNITGILKAYKMLPKAIKDEYQLVICGKKGWMYEEIFEYIRDNNLEDRIVFTGFVKEDHLSAIYKGAKVFLYASFYEGFGIPLIEAMASGVPCITSDLSSMKEVAGNACLKIDPYNVDEIKNAIIRLLTDSNLNEKIIQEGKIRAREYTWENCALKTLEIYESIKEK